MNGAPLTQALRLGALSLPNRIVMAPLTRMRAGARQVPSAMNAAYYAQRASAGLIITEATHISAEARGLPDVPGIYTAEQIAGWRDVTEAVHSCGGRIVQQLFHVGRLSHSSYRQDARPVGPSALAAPGQGYTADFTLADYELPRALDAREIACIVDAFRQAALNARAAGFDGIELHAANGYLLEQFMVDGSNLRDDDYGGSVKGRCRLLLQVVDAVCAAIGAERVGIRLSPFGRAGGSQDSDPAALYRYAIGELNNRTPAYLHLIEARASSMGRSDYIDEAAVDVLGLLRGAFDGPVISAGGYTPASAAATVAAGRADAIAFGRMFIANPDLVTRIERAAPLNAYQRATFYGGSTRGYTDYPTLEQPAR
jgi:N-ethylmaleimide reductase